eukprot:11965258-Alexandrium_andersonii.AAC.1
MDIGALEPEPSDADPEAQELNAAFAALQRWIKGKDKGKGGKSGSPATLGGPASAGGAKGGGKGAFQGRRWKCNE